MHLFYTPDLQGKAYLLSEEESKHAVRVLRLDVGEKVELLDGKGGRYEAEVLDANPKRCALQILKEQQGYGKKEYHIHLAVAPTKNIERIEWLLEKATEIGIDRITPLICQRSERKEVKIERLDKILIAAMKQSMKAYKPVLEEAKSFKQWMQMEQEGVKMIAHCASAEKKSIRDTIQAKKGNYIILIGPEGDFSPDEIALAQSKGYAAITLGDSRLRTETAALSAVFELNYLNR